MPLSRSQLRQENTRQSHLLDEEAGRTRITVDMLAIKFGSTLEEAQGGLIQTSQFSVTRRAPRSGVRFFEPRPQTRLQTIDPPD